MRHDILSSWLLGGLFWALVAIQPPALIDATQSNLQTERVSCESGQGCILSREWASPWLADLHERSLRLLESDVRTSHSSAPTQSGFDSFESPLSIHSQRLHSPTLAEDALALLYPYHELG